MYRKTETTSGNSQDISNYINGYDVYDSVLINVISDISSYDRQSYTINVYEYRPDLIAEDFYGSTSYLGILLLQTKMSVGDFKRGVVLSLLPKKTVDGLLKAI